MFSHNILVRQFRGFRGDVIRKWLDNIWHLAKEYYQKISAVMFAGLHSIKYFKLDEHYTIKFVYLQNPFSEWSMYNKIYDVFKCSLTLVEHFCTEPLLMKPMWSETPRVRCPSCSNSSACHQCYAFYALWFFLYTQHYWWTLEAKFK